MEGVFSILFLSAFLTALMPDGNSKDAVKMMTGLIALIKISELIISVFRNLE